MFYFVRTGTFQLDTGEIMCQLTSSRRVNASTVGFDAVCDVENNVLGRGRLTMQILSMDRIILTYPDLSASPPGGTGKDVTRFDFYRCKE
jgi:hypothetical protein